MASIELPVDIELELIRGGVADAHRGGALVAGQPRHLPFSQLPFTGQAIHDLDLARAARHAALQPRPPRLRFLDIARGHQCQQRQGRVAQPAIAVVPVALATELLGQATWWVRRRSRRSSDRSTPSRSTKSAAPAPAKDRCRSNGPHQPRQNPSVSRKAVCQSTAAGAGRWDGPWVRTNGTHCPSTTSNSAMVAKFSPCSATGVPQHHLARPGNCAQAGLVLEPRHPWHRGAVVEAQGQVRSHRHLAAAPLYQTDDGGMAWPTGMKSIRATRPSAVSKMVSSTMVPSR